ncbi:MAG: site-2 protease family protein [Planctomycetes bacterium]|nr:site-2 protease family protein [Planctomycetota bacterium]
METFVLIGVIVIVIVSITTHEVAHGWVAYLCGDHTAKSLGRLTLNPVPHIDPFMTIGLPLILVLSGAPMIGGAKPVPVNPMLLGKPRRDMAFVAAAGPISNLLIAFVLVGILAAFLKSGYWPKDSLGAQVLALGAYWNIFLGFLNLAPIPPLDGSKIVASFLRGEAEVFWWKLQRIGLFVLLGIFFFAPEVLYFFVLTPGSEVAYWMGDLFGIRNELVQAVNLGFGS